MINNRALIATKYHLSTQQTLELYKQIKELKQFAAAKDVVSLGDAIENVFYKQNKTSVDNALLEYVKSKQDFMSYLPSDRGEYSVVLAALIKACDRLGESGWFTPDGKEMSAEDWLIKLIAEARHYNG